MRCLEGWKEMNSPIVVGIASMIFSVSPATAFTGTNLYEACMKEPNSAGDLFCTSYVRGFIDGMLLGDTAAGVGTRYCGPREGIGVVQGRLIVEKYMRDHPEKLNLPAGNIAFSAMYEAFPCPESN